MAKGKKESDPGTLGRLSKRGEDALTRFVEELGKNERFSDALGRASAAKGKVEGASRKALGQAGMAASEELADLRKHVERLEKRLAKLEGDSAPKGSTAGKTAAKPKKPAAAKPATERPAPPPAEPPATPGS
jgi:hypothetical protein